MTEIYSHNKYKHIYVYVCSPLLVKNKMNLKSMFKFMFLNYFTTKSKVIACKQIKFHHKKCAQIGVKNTCY